MKRGFLIICALLLTIYSLGTWGCSKKVTGPPRVNQAPYVQFVNIPVGGTKFSADTSVYWYGTDVDGFIRYYRYAVVESSMVARLGGDDVMQFVANYPDSIDWTVLNVTKDSAQTSARIKLKADSLDPVRTFVASYVLLQAIDNLGAESEVAYRMFRKNDHFPETTIGYINVFDPFVNAHDQSGVIQGVPVAWSAKDPIDYPRNPPPFQYRWRCFGPYTKPVYDSLRKYLKARVFVDAFGDYYLNGDHLQILDHIDTTINSSVTPPETTFTPIYNELLVDTLGAGDEALGKWRNYFIGAFRGLDTLIFSQDSLLALKEWRDLLDPNVSTGILVRESPGWTYNQSTTLFNLFANQQVDASSDTTRTGFFLFACQARDDASVPDKVPSSAFLQVIEPKFERDLLIIDETRYSTSYPKINYPFHPRNPVALSQFPNPNPSKFWVRDIYGRMANAWKPGCFDTAVVLNEVYGPDGTYLGYSTQGCTQDYIANKNLYTSFPDSLGIQPVPLRDVLKHKVVLFIKDGLGDGLNFSDDIARNVIKGMNAGMSVWTMARGAFSTQPYAALDSAYFETILPAYRTYFAIDSMFQPGWQGIVADYYVDKAQLLQDPTQLKLPYRDTLYRTENFIGGDAIDGNAVGVPDAYIDSALLRTRYVWIDPTPLLPPGVPPPDYTYWPYIDTLPALPSVGALEPILLPGVHSLYRYRSLFYARVENGQIVEEYSTPQIPWYVKDWSRVYEGKICAIAYETQVFKTSHFCFPLYTVDETEAQQVFNKMMDWLEIQPFIQTGNFSTSSPGRVSVSKLRSIEEEYDEMYRNHQLSDQVNATENR